MTLLTIALAAFTFKGGTPTAFANQLFDDTKQPIMISQGVGVKIPAMEFDPADINSIYAAFRGSESMSKMPGVEMMFTDGLVPPNSLGLTIRLNSQTSAKSTAPAKDSVKDGKVSIKLEDGQWCPLSEIASLPFSKTLTIHPRLADQNISMRVEDMDEREFLIRLAKLVGGHLTTTETTYSILPYASEYAKRVEKTIRTAVRDVDANSNSLFMLGVETRIALIRELSNNELLNALDPTTPRVDLWMSNKPKATAQFVKWLQVSMQNQQSGGRGGRSNQRIDVRSVNWQQSTFRLDNELNVSVSLVALDSSNRLRRYTLNVTQSTNGRRRGGEQVIVSGGL